jgi:hypothetical protein
MSLRSLMLQFPVSVQATEQGFGKSRSCDHVLPESWLLRLNAIKLTICKPSSMISMAYLILMPLLLCLELFRRSGSFCPFTLAESHLTAQGVAITTNPEYTTAFTERHELLLLLFVVTCDFIGWYLF